MTDLAAKDYIVVVQCDIATQRCSGYFCEQAFHGREGGFAGYPRDESYRLIYLTCGGCCGKALQRKLMHLIQQRKKREGADKGRIVVQLASCITTDNHHGPPCPHLDYLLKLIERTGLDVRMNTRISEHTEQKRAEGLYQPRPE